MDLNAKETETPGWTQRGDVIECRVDDQAYDASFEDSVALKLYVDEVLEKFEARRVLVASAREVVADDISDEAREALLHPTYLIEESKKVAEERDRDWSEPLKELVRLPIEVQQTEGLKRSVFVDNVGISVGDLVDLVRGELKIHQIEMIFGAVSELFEKLHDSGWVHLGLTPWNVRVFDEQNGDDGFLKAFLSDSVSADRATVLTPPDAENQEDDEETQDKPFDDRGRTVVELKPLGEGQDNRDAETNDDELQADEGEEQPEAIDTNESDDLEDANGDVEEDGDQSAAVVDDDLNMARAQSFESEVSFAELDETSVSEVVPETGGLMAILDGIDRLYPAGKINDEIAVTPGFSAPELLSGLGTEDGETADIFSLGMFLYFLTAGVVPPASVYTRYSPAIPARNFRPGFAPGLQAVIARATRPRPEDRFASIKTLMEAFDDAVEVMRRRQHEGVAMPPKLRLASDTHIGIAKRRSNPTNQDSVFSATSDDNRFSLVVVADGVSTANYGSGDLASTALTEEAQKVWEEVLPMYLMDEEFNPIDIISSIMSRANDRIVNYVNEHHTPFRGSPHEVMGSTALVALIIDGMVTLGSLGDSRVYLQRGAGMEQLTIDHNLWTLSILEGVGADSALSMPHGDALARCLGTFIVEKGTLDAVDPKPDLFRFQFMEGDTLLMTTDGLVDFAGTNLLASEDNILSVLLAEPDPALACLELILLANRGGGGDNIGLSVIRFQ